MKEAAWRIILEYGDSAARVRLVQPVGQHELPLIEDEIVLIGQMTDRPFRYLAVQVENWNRDLSPWPAPAVFGDEDFGDGAEALLEEILPVCAVERLPDGCVQRRGGGLTVSLVSRIFCIYEGKRP